jgi:hypothetical protein
MTQNNIMLPRKNIETIITKKVSPTIQIEYEKHKKKVKALKSQC